MYTTVSTTQNTSSGQIILQRGHIPEMWPVVKILYHF